MEIFLEKTVPGIVYLTNDPNRILYYKDSVPKNLKVTKPSTAVLLEILAKKLSSLEISDLEWLHCAISSELPKEPVFFPTREGITALYEREELVKWFKYTSKALPVEPAAPNDIFVDFFNYFFSNPMKDDPTGLKQNATIKDYRKPTTEEILAYVVKASKLSPDFLIANYNITNEPAFLEDEPLLENDSPDEESSCFPFSWNFFGCGKVRTAQERPEQSEQAKPDESEQLLTL